MKLRVLGLLLGVALTATLAVILLQPGRPQNLYCRFATCPVTHDLDNVCRVVATAAGFPIQQRYEEMARRFVATWPTPRAHRLAEAVGNAPAGERYDVIVDALLAEGVQNWSCAPLTDWLSATLAVTQRHLTLDGVPVAALEAGLLRAEALDPSGMRIEPLLAALERRKEQRPLVLGFHPALPFGTLAQVLATLGAAGHAQVQLMPLDLQKPALTVSLPALGTCPTCLTTPGEMLALPQLSEGRSLMTLLGHRAEPKPDPALDAHALALTVALTLEGQVYVAGRGGVLASPGGKGPTVGGNTAALDLEALSLRLNEVRAVFPDDRDVIVGADLRARSALFHSLLEHLHQAPPNFERMFVGVPLPVWLGDATLTESLERSAGLALNTRAELSTSYPPERPKAGPRGTVQLEPKEQARLTNTRALRPAPDAPGWAERFWSDALRNPKSGAAMAKAVAAQWAPLTACYEKILQEQPQLSGQLQVQLGLAKGKVKQWSVVGSIQAPSLEACLERAMRAWRLPRVDAFVGLPLSFRPG